MDIQVPPGVRGGRHGIILFNFSSSEFAAPGGVQIKGELGTIFLLEIALTQTRKGAISDFLIAKGNEGATFSAIFHNKGNVLIKASGSVIIRDDSNKVVDRLPLNGGTGTILPEGKRNFTGKWNNRRKLSPGKYFAEVRMLFPGNSEVLKVQRDFLFSK